VIVRVCAALSLCVVLTVPAAAQNRQAGPARPASDSPDESAALARGWKLLSEGAYSPAEAQAQDVLRKNPRSVSALALAVDAAIGLKGAMAGLDQYERWLGARRLEEPGILRRVSSALLREAARNSGTRLLALRGLSGDGDEAAADEIAALARQGGAAELRMMAEWGDQAAAKTLVTQLGRGDADPVRTIEAIGQSGYAAAIRPVAAWLEDERPEVRGSAADALGKLGAQSPEVAALLKSLLADRSPHVRTRAAAALYRLGDPAGTPWLQELAASAVPAGRLVAAEAMSSRPDAAWTALVTELATTGGDAEVRLGAARLLAPHNADLANSVARELAGDANIAIRELAASVMSETVSEEGLTVLRGQLRAASEVIRLRAASRILDVTR
jgi:HEAT repeat protein